MIEFGKQIELNELKEISLDILLTVAKFCEENKIVYFLACGTLLGAVKYKGFIPWDDDVDIMMPRPDYEKFVELFENDRYKLIKPREGKYYYAKVYDSKTIKLENGRDNKGKITGVDIDVFPLDGIINDLNVINEILSKSKKLETLLRLSNQNIFYRKNPIKAINRIIPRIIGSSNLVKQIEKNAKTYSYENSDYVIRVRNTPMGKAKALRKEIFEKDYLEFEGTKFCVPKGYDEYLKSFFGDNYMNELPPEDQRVPHHKNKCYWVKDNG